jgi:hypothetical protein
LSHWSPSVETQRTQSFELAYKKECNGKLRVRRIWHSPQFLPKLKESKENRIGNLVGTKIKQALELPINEPKMQASSPWCHDAKEQNNFG